MHQDAKAHSKKKKDEERGWVGLFDLDPAAIPVESLTWEPTESWDPTIRSWW
jgi:hypothetical protein